MKATVSKLNMDAVYSSQIACTTCFYGLVVDAVPTCGFNDKPIAFFDKSYACPKGFWKQEDVYIRAFSEPKVEFHAETKTLWLTKANAKIEAELDAAYARVPGLLRWQIEDKPLLDRFISFGRSLTSGTATPEVVEQRKRSCFGTETEPVCPALKKTEQGSFCSGCSCGTWSLAKLDGEIAPKLSWKYLQCPLKRPGFSNSAPVSSSTGKLPAAP